MRFSPVLLIFLTHEGGALVGAFGPKLRAPRKRARIPARGGSRGTPLGQNHHCCSGLVEPPYKRSAVSAGCQKGAAFPTGAAGHQLPGRFLHAKLRTAIRRAIAAGVTGGDLNPA
jgi:hypothetical protein